MGPGDWFIPPSDNQGEGLVGAFDQTDGLLSGSTDGNCVDVDDLISHLQADGRRLAALLHLGYAQWFSVLQTPSESEPPRRPTKQQDIHKSIFNIIPNPVPDTLESVRV